MGPSPIGKKILKLFGLSNGKLTKSCANDKNVPINLYTNFYFKVEQQSENENSENSCPTEYPVFEVVDFTRNYTFTEENVKRIGKLQKSNF